MEDGGVQFRSSEVTASPKYDLYHSFCHSALILRWELTKDSILDSLSSIFHPLSSIFHPHRHSLLGFLTYLGAQTVFSSVAQNLQRNLCSRRLARNNPIELYRRRNRLAVDRGNQIILAQA
jgi:hypothetical protein